METLEQEQSSNIVIIENNTLLCEQMRRTLGSNNFSVTSFSESGDADAVEYIARNQSRKDLVITDLDMPISGLEIIDRIRSFNKSISILVYSANINPDTHSSIKEKGILLVHKPMPASEFISWVRRALMEGR